MLSRVKKKNGNGVAVRSRPTLTD